MSRSIATTLVLAGLGLALTGCGYTTEGAGEDLSATGHAITHSATESTP